MINNKNKRRNTYKKRQKTRRATTRKNKSIRKSRIRSSRGYRQKGGNSAYVPPPYAIVDYRDLDDDMMGVPRLMTYEEAKKAKSEWSTF